MAVDPVAAAASVERKSGATFLLLQTVGATEDREEGVTKASTVAPVRSRRVVARVMRILAIFVNIGVYMYEC